jgi:hypothetical protein
LSLCDKRDAPAAHTISGIAIPADRMFRDVRLLKLEADMPRHSRVRDSGPNFAMGPTADPEAGTGILLGQFGVHTSASPDANEFPVVVPARTLA